MARHGRFFDGESMDPEVAPTILLERVVRDGHERFRMERRLAYQDPHHDEPHVVPADTTVFVSDLTSVPSLFTWLVPRTGVHLPAALVHDGMVHEEGEPLSYLGPAVDRVEADRIFRDAMAALGTSLPRRWLMWTAVTVATIWRGAVRPVAYHRAVVVLTIAVIVGLGTLATLDALDVWDGLFWMGDRPWYLELLGGALGALVIPALLSLAWGRLWRAGLIAGVALAFLLHVTVVLAVLTLGFSLLERVLGGLDHGRSPSRTGSGRDTTRP